MKRKRKPTRKMATLTQISSIRHLKLNKRGGRPGANMSPIVNRLQHVITAKSLLSKPSTPNTLQDYCPTGTSKSGGIRHSKCHPVEQTSQITMVAACLALPHNLHLKAAEI
jgi:hypothetical protein